MMSTPAGAINDSPRVHEIANQLTLSWPSRNQKICIVFAGFQGSGKSTMVEKLCEQYDFAVISTDAIRQSLIDLNIEPSSPDFDRLLKRTYQFLLAKATNMQLPIIVDANAHKERKTELDKLLRQKEYRSVAIYLKAPVETLKSRIVAREKNPRVYQGTVQEMLGSLDKPIEEKDYFVIETSGQSPETTFQAVLGAVQPLDPQKKDPILNEYLALNRFSDELETQATIDCAESFKHPKKSRGWHPRDLNRVKLSISPDYINASEIQFDNFHIIAAQGPTEETKSDFIQMLADLQNPLIIDLAQAQEPIATYWPSDALVETGPDYIIRQWSNSSVCQTHYLDWKDGTSLSPKNFYRIAHLIAMCLESQPIVVHCKGGIGRTGTAIAGVWILKIFLKHIKEGKTPGTFNTSIFEIVKHLRNQRNFLVHTEVQYRSLYAFADLLRHFSDESIQNLLKDFSNAP